MSNVKYRLREYTPKTQNQGTHSWYPEAVINGDLTNVDLAKKIAARTGMKAYEAQMAVAAIADIVMEEALESNSITLSDERGKKMVTFYPKVTGGVSDTDILRETTAKHAIDPTVPIRTVAEESDVTTNRMNWTIGATVGIRFSKDFAHDKEAKRVKSTDNAEAIISNDDNHSNTSTGTVDTSSNVTPGEGEDGLGG